MTALNPDKSSRSRRRTRWLWLLLPGLAAAAVIVWLAQRPSASHDIARFTVARGPLNITVIEGGSIRAVDSQEIKCEVRVGYQGLKILKIVDEGYEVTLDDIRTNKVLVELDSSELQKQIMQDDIQYETSVATLTDAQQNYEIQLNQNLSDVKAAEQKMRFARLDFDKFLGAQVTQAVVDRLGVQQEMAAEEATAAASLSAVTNSPAPPTGSPRPPAPGGKPEGSPAPAPAEGTRAKSASLGPDEAAAPRVILARADGKLREGALPGRVEPANAAANPAGQAGSAASPAGEGTNEVRVAPASPPLAIDFSEYAHIEVLGDGEAKQKLRKFEDDLQVAQKEQGQAQANLAGTRRLFEKGFVTRMDQEKDELAAENARLKVQTAETARDLFLKYEFPKTAEESLSKFTEATRELARARKAAVSRLAQAQAKLKSAQGQFNIQSRRRKENYEQLEKCNIRATRQGLVVYGRGSDDTMFFGNEERIREGASVRERQSIITIPDMTRMSVRVKIHESYIKQIRKGQAAQVTVDAYPDKVLAGEVTTVGVLPDSQNMWMNPDMKVYLTTIALTGTNEWLKPGMSAKVEIMVKRIEDAVYVPVQAVWPQDGKQVCYVGRGVKPERRPVQTGEFNDEFIEIKSGLKPGEQVLLRPAESPGAENGPQKTEEKTEPKTTEPGTTEPKKGPA